METKRQEVDASQYRDDQLEAAMTESKQDRLIPFKDVSRITGIKSINTIKAQEARGEFPKRRYLSEKCVRWSEAEIIAWMNQLPRSFKELQHRHSQEAA